MGFRDEIQKVVEAHNEAPIVHESKRHLGIILTIVGYILYALYTVFFQTEIFKNHASTSLYTVFFELSILNLVMTITFFVFCSGQEKGFFKCNRPKLVYTRSICGFVLLLFYSLSRIWTDNVDNSMLYSTDSFWLVLFLYLFNFKFPKGVWPGVLIGTAGIFFIYTFDLSSIHGILGAAFGTISGILLAVVIFLTRYMVRRDPPLRICFYNALIALIGSVIGTIIFGSLNSWEIPILSSMYVMVISGLIWGLALFCFLEAFYFAENHVIGAMALFLPVFVESFNWEINTQVFSWKTLVGSLIMTLGGLIVIFATYHHDKNNCKQVKDQIKFPELIKDKSVKKRN